MSSSENKENILILKVDVDTLQGYLQGVPRMAEVLKTHGVKASFYFSFGPDNSGRAIIRIFRKGFLEKMLRTKAPSTYGLKTMMYGTLLPGPMIVDADPHIVGDIFKAGHECGIHAWDHVKWQDRLEKLTTEEIKQDLRKAVDKYEKILNVRPLGFAAPGWQITKNALAALDSFNFDYVSNTRGFSPFTPSYEGVKFLTPEIPSTMPTMDEVFGTDGIDDDTVVSYYLYQLKPGLNVHTVHAEMEGGGKIKQFEAIVKGALKKGYKIIPMAEYVKQQIVFPQGEIVQGFLPGRAGSLALQKEEKN